MKNDDAMAAKAAIAAKVAEFYDRHPYPPAADDVDAYRRSWNEQRRRAEYHLFWPDQPYRDDRSILVAGCGTRQAAHYAVRWPKARVIGIDFSDRSIGFEDELKRKHALKNLEVRRLEIERAAELRERFDLVVCTGVLHHLPDPDAGLRALCEVLVPNGGMHLMVYSPYGRAGIYMMQEYCRRLGIGSSAADIRDLVESLKALPPDHPLGPLLQKSPDFASEAGIADALLHPNDRAYSVPQFMDLLDRAQLRFGRWLRQAPYRGSCGAIASTPHGPKIAALAGSKEYAMMELFRGTMVRHSAIVYRSDAAIRDIDFGDDSWLGYVPIRLPETIVVHDRLPPGASAVLINRSHTYTDLYLPIDAVRERMLEAIDGKRRIAEMGRATMDKALARDFFEELWRWDQVVFDTAKNRASSTDSMA